jgi:hypothetical protein
VRTWRVELSSGLVEDVEAKGVGIEDGALLFFVTDDHGLVAIRGFGPGMWFQFREVRDGE